MASTPPANPPAAEPADEAKSPVVEVPNPGMDWVARDAGERMGLREAAGDEEDVEPGPDTSAYRRGSAAGQDADRALLSPRLGKGGGSNLEPLLAIPVLEVTPQLRAALARDQPEPDPEPPERTPFCRYSLGSSPGPEQRCPECKSSLRVVRSSHEERLDATWFRYEWLDIERGWGDCPTHPRVETRPLERPAFLADGRMGNGLLAWIATWRWQDHMPPHEILHLLKGLGLHPDERWLARWLAQARPVIGAVADAVREQVSGDEDERGLQLNEGRSTGRLRARSSKKGVAFTWQQEEPPTVGDNPTERARDVLLAVRGWSRAGRQASLRRRLAQQACTDPQLGARLAWRAEELRRATDADQEGEIMAGLEQDLAGGAEDRPALVGLQLDLAEGREHLLRYAKGTTLRPPLELPETARFRLPAWFASSGDGGAEAMADWFSVIESCAQLGLPTWSYLRDLFTAAAEQGEDLKAAKWTPAARS